jgi:hypothetical protein
MNTRAVVVTAAILAALVVIPAIALAGVPQFEGTAGKASVGIEVKGSGTHITRVKSFGWDALKCGQDRFTGGTSKSIKVKDGAFSSTQPVGGVNVSLKLKLKGKFTAGGTKAKGTLKITGACKTGKVKWSAKLVPQQGQQG